MKTCFVEKMRKWRFDMQSCTVNLMLCLGLLALTTFQAQAHEKQVAFVNPLSIQIPSVFPSNTVRPIHRKALPASVHGQPAADVVIEALHMIGVQYQWGGNTPASGMDCSGFVKYVFENAINVTLPRRAVQMSRVGRTVPIHQLSPGDLVFFNTHNSRTKRRVVSHVGIYIGDNQFVHSPRTGKTIRVDRLGNRYWKQRYTGAKRVNRLFASAS